MRAAHQSLIGACMSIILFSGCEKMMKNMYEQPKYKPMVESSLWSDGQSARPLEPGTIAYSAGANAGTSSGRLGGLALPERTVPVYPVDAQGRMLADPIHATAQPQSAANPLSVTPDTLQRGQQRYNIYCAPCHSETGDGDGMVVRRGFPRPLSFHTDKLRAATDAHFYDAMTNGYGVMYSYAERVDAHDRWAIAAYIRALQLSQNARLDDVPEADRTKLGGPAK
jgi:cytochrome c553